MRGCAMPVYRSVTKPGACLISLAWGACVTALLALLVACTPPADPGAPTDKTLQALLAEHATRTRVEEVLGKGYKWYEKGTSSWRAYESALSSEPERVRDAAEKHPRLMYYTTMWQRTWIFLDDHDVMQVYFTSTQ